MDLASKIGKVLFWITLLTSIISLIMFFINLSDLSDTIDAICALGGNPKEFQMYFEAILPTFTQVCICFIFYCMAYLD